MIERRQSNDDGRVWLLRLTDEGERRLMDAFAALRADRDTLAATFDEVGTMFRAVTRE